jgi:hypothetical protein
VTAGPGTRSLAVPDIRSNTAAANEMGAATSETGPLTRATVDGAW